MTPILLTPGPVTTSEHVRRAMLQDSGTWDDDYLSLTQNVRSQILQLATKDVADFAVVLLQGSGTYAVEAALSSMVPRTGTLGILINGAYGERMLDIAAMQHSNRSITHCRIFSALSGSYCKITR